MARRAVFVPYQPKTVLNKSKRPDHWFWTRYSAYPYVGCQHGCHFCYCRERKYCPDDDPADFPYVVKAKVNAPALLRRALLRAPRDLLFTGDYQPAERVFGLSRQILQVCAELAFPVMVLERSPLVLRDLDLLQEINRKSRAVVAFSAISAPGSPHHEESRRMEGLAPPAEKRFAAMEKIAGAGILTGTCFMPILPGLCDDEANLRNVVRWTADHGGSFVLASSLTLADQQREYVLRVLQGQFPDVVARYVKLYPVGSYAPVSYPWREIALRIREYCGVARIQDRMPRPIISGEGRALNKRVVEALAGQVYALELEGAPAARVWAHRKAAWAIEDLDQELGLAYRALGLRGLQSMPGMTAQTAREVVQLMMQLDLDGQANASAATNDAGDGWWAGS